MSQNKTQSRAWLIIAGVLLGAGALLFFSYKHRRNHWPSALTRRLAELKTNGVPASLEECDRRYRALGSTPAAVQHYQKAFAAMAAGRLPLLPPTLQAQQVRPSLPRFSSKPFAFQALPKGYVISAAGSADAPGAGAEATRQSEPDEPVFRVERK